MSKTKKPGSGRTLGAGSFCRVKLKELKRLLGDDADVVVAIRFARELNAEYAPFEATTANIKSFAQPAVPVVVEDFNIDNETVLNKT